MRDVYVAGVGMIRFGRYRDRDVPDLGGEALLLALDDAGLALRDVELLAAGSLFQANAMVGQRILQQVGQTGIPVVNVANACATGSTAFREAWLAVASGEHEVAVAVGVEQMGKMGLLGGGGGSGVRTEGVLGSGLMPAVFGQAGMEHMRRHGTTQAQFAKVAVKNHRHSTRNPLSQYQVEVSLDEVLNARMVAYPNTLYMCCPTGDGEAGRLIDTGETAHGGRIPVNVSGGLLSKGHPLGATGVANIFEIVQHLRGRAAARQVDGARVGLAHVIGLGSACTINILGV